MPHGRTSINSVRKDLYIAVKQWCTENDINEKAYYYWLRKFRREAAEQMSAPATADNVSPITFADIPYGNSSHGYDGSTSDKSLVVHPTAVLKFKGYMLAVTTTSLIRYCQQSSGRCPMLEHIASIRKVVIDLQKCLTSTLHINGCRNGGI